MIFKVWFWVNENQTLIRTELWRILETHASVFELSQGRAVFEIIMFHSGQDVRSTCNTHPVQFPSSWHSHQCQRRKQYTLMPLFLLVSVFRAFTVRKADHLPQMGAGDTNPPRFVPGLLRAQDQCPPGWQMALMKLDNSAYMHKRMLNIDSEDQRSGAYSTL